MIKAVFFDLYHTLIHYYPRREQVLALSLDRRGIKAEMSELRRAIIVGDEFFYQENARNRVGRRTETEAHAFWLEYQSVVLKEAGITPNLELLEGIVADMQQAPFERVLFDDVLPALDLLVGRGFKLGLISNVDQDISPLLNKLGLSSYFAVVLTSKDVGVTKPDPRIFHEAVKRVGVETAETMYIGDQYQIDTLGALNAGLKALLLDRENSHPELAATEKINSLDELQNKLA